MGLVVEAVKGTKLAHLINLTEPKWLLAEWGVEKTGTSV